jgi:formylglycine-generating enzyme required for sulfatase activity
MKAVGEFHTTHWSVSKYCIVFWISLSFVAGAAAQVPASLGMRLYPGLSITGEVGSVYTIQYATALSNVPSWHGLSIVQLTNAVHLFVDTTVSAREERFYRTLAGPQDMKWIPPGSFMMGSPSNEVGRATDEGPQTLVTLTRGFFMGRREVSQGAYVSLIGTNPSTYPDLKRPVETVSWQDAVAYCALLTQSERDAGRLPPGWAYRLPTEAEWEYACRAGTMSRFSHGDDSGYGLLASYAWFGDPTGGQTHQVGTLLPNPWGLYDMHGNVWELCQDVMTYSGGRVTDPVPAGGAARMTRGGSWHSLGQRCRSATRNNYDTTNREAWVGFRIVLAEN